MILNIVGQQIRMGIKKLFLLVKYYLSTLEITLILVVIIVATISLTCKLKSDFWVVIGGAAQTIAVLFAYKALIQSEKSLKFVLMPSLHITIKDQGVTHPLLEPGDLRKHGMVLLNIINTGQGPAKNIKITVYKKAENVDQDFEMIKGMKYKVAKSIFFSETDPPCKQSLNDLQPIDLIKSQEVKPICFTYIKANLSEGLISVIYKTDYALEPELVSYHTFAPDTRTGKENMYLFNEL